MAAGKAVGASSFLLGGYYEHSELFALGIISESQFIP